MSAQEKLPLSKNSVAQWIHVVIILFFMFGFKYVCPPFSTITEVGVGVLGVFIGLVYGWTTCGVFWTSILGMIALGFTGFQTVTESLQYGISHNNVLTLLFVFPFMYIIEEAGIVRWISYKLVNLRIGRGRPWVLSFLLVFTAAIISALVNPFVAIFFVWSMFYSVCDICHLEKGKYTQFMIAGIAFGATIGCQLFIFSPPVMQAVGVYEGIAGYTFNAVKYSVWVLVVETVYYILFVLYGKFILRLDLSNIQIDKIEGGEDHLDTYQKITMVFLVLFLVFMFWPSFLPAEWTSSQVFSALGSKGVPAILLVAMVMLNFSKGIDINEMFTKGIRWSAIFLTACVMVIINAVGSPEVGISDALAALLSPLLEGRSALVFIAIVTLIPAIITNFGSNVVVALLFIPISYTFASTAGFNYHAIALAVFLCSNAALGTPAGCATAAILHGNSEWITSGQAARHGAVQVVIVWASTLLIGYPLGCFLFPV